MSLKSARPLILAAALGIAMTGSPSYAAPFDKVETSEASATLSAYQQVFISPVEVDLKGRQTGALARLRAKQARVYDDEASEKAEDFYQILVAELQDEVELVGAPGPGVLTISPTITKLAPSRLNTVTGARNISRNSITSVYAGGAKIELTLSDQGATLATIKDGFQSSLNDGAPRITRWQDTDDAFANFSAKLKRYIANN